MARTFASRLIEFDAQAAEYDINPLMIQFPEQKSDRLLFVDRARHTLCEERIYGERAVRWLYESGPGYLLERTLLSRKPLSFIYGLFNDTRWSARRVPEFVSTYEIDLGLFEVPLPGFVSFNDFFVRRYKLGLRPFPVAEGVLGAPAEGRYFVFDKLSDGTFFPIKGQSLSLAALLGDASLAQRFDGGTALVARLCPVDYHRYHFPDDGVPAAARRIKGALHSVNPKALARRPTIFQENERVLTLFNSEHFGLMAYLEVGAMCVGRMEQTYQPDKAVRRGDEKGYFRFGASTVVLLTLPGALKPDADLVENTARGYETYLKLGERLGQRV